MTRKTRIKFGDREVYFYRRKDSGQFVFGYKVGDDWRETRCPRNVCAQRDAEAYARAFLEEFVRVGGKPEIVPPDPTLAKKQPTVAEVAERWLDYRKDKAELAQATKDQGKSNVHTHIAPKLRDPNATDPILGDMRVDELGSGALRQWVRRLKAIRKPRTVNNIATTLTVMLDEAMAEEWIENGPNPMMHKGVRNELPEVIPTSGADRVCLTRPVAEALLRCEKVPEHRKVRYLSEMTSGMREGELAGLLWSDVDLDAKIPWVEVTKALQLRGKNGPTSIGEPKTRASKRKLPLHPLTVRALRAWKAKGWQQYVGHKPRPSDPVFPDEHGKYCRPRSAQLIRDDLELAKQPYQSWQLQYRRSRVSTQFSDLAHQRGGVRRHH